MTSTSLHDPKQVKVTTLSEGAIVITITDDQRNDVAIFFDGFTHFINFASRLMTGETQGNRYEIPAGE